MKHRSLSARPTIAAGDDGYDATRRLDHGMIDQRLLLLARCGDVADVIAAVNFGREHGPENLFRVNQNIVPARSRREEPVAAAGR